MKWTILFLSVLNLQAVGQTMISGKVTDQQGAIVPGANVMIKGTYDGASSNQEGAFRFTTTETGDQILSVSFIGYTTAEQAIALTGTPLEVTLVLKEEINQLEAVTIAAGSFTAGEEKRRTILKAVDIATTAGATADIAGALNTLPGTTKVGESGRLFVRGGDGSETRTFVDGMVVLEAYRPSAPNTPSRGRFMPFMFKGTSFSTGGYSAEYGQALSSALVLNSKDKAEISQTDIGILSVGADVGHTEVWERGSVSGKIQYTDIRPYFNLIKQYVDWHTPPTSFESSAAFRQETGKDGLFKFYGTYNQSQYAMYNHDVAQPEIKTLVELDNTFGYGNGSYQQSVSKNWSVRGGMSYNYNRNVYRLDGVPYGEKENGIHTKLVAEHTLSDKVEVRMGGEVIARDYEASMEESGTGNKLVQGFREVVSATFVEAEAYASSKFITKAGARLEHNSLTGQVSVDPRISLAYKPGKLGQFAFAYGRFRQSVTNNYLRVNPTLGQEKASHYILNYQFITGQRTFRVETYYKKYDNLLKYFNGDVKTSNNTGYGYAKGIEFFWRDNQSLRNVDYWVSYSFLDTERDYLNFPHTAVPSFASAHNFSFVYKHFVQPIKCQLGFTYSYSSGRPYYNPNNAAFNTDRTPSYQDLSANVAYLPKSWLIIYFSCTNILGRDNIFGYTYATTPGTDGVYASQPVRQPANRFIFLGLLITISKNKSINQLPNL
ncbi:MAG: TonB-dependent receptor [Cyclobacteriaceae bacterium]|nr:TonB-dependent receptor [Cyclobacteriaceae bacterium]